MNGDGMLTTKVQLPRDLRRGACVDLDDPEVMMGRSVKDRDTAARLCADCPVKQVCADYALELQKRDTERRVVGVWGGRFFFDSGSKHSRLLGPRLDLPGKSKHGKTGYGLGCRCLECSNANAEQGARQRAKGAEAA